MANDLLERILFLDLETTGFEPKEQTILEVYAKPYLDPPSGPWEFHAVRLASVGRRYPQVEKHYVSVPDSIVEYQLDPVVYNMHTKSGLIYDMDPEHETSPIDPVRMNLDHMDTMLSSLMSSGMILAGYSIHFDRAFIYEHMPQVYQKLHHRVIDVSTLRELTKCYAPNLSYKLPGAVAHRSRADVYAAHDEFQHLSKELWGVVDGKADPSTVMLPPPGSMPRDPFDGRYPEGATVSTDQSPKRGLTEFFRKKFNTVL